MGLYSKKQTDNPLKGGESNDKDSKARPHPNRTMKKFLDDLCDYRRYRWNQGLALWSDMYDVSLILEDKELLPNERKVRNELVADKSDWQYQLSARYLQLAVSDLGKTWKNFFNKHQFKSKKAPRQGQNRQWKVAIR